MIINIKEVVDYAIGEAVIKQSLENQNSMLIKANADLAVKVVELERRVKELALQCAPK